MRIPGAFEGRRKLNVLEVTRGIEPVGEPPAFDLEAEVTQEDWDAVWASLEQNAVVKKGTFGGADRSWRNLQVLVTWVQLVDPNQLSRFKNDERILALGREKIGWGANDPQAAVLAHQLFPDLLTDDLKTNPNLLAMYTPNLVGEVLESSENDGLLLPAKPFVHFLQLRPAELSQIQEIFETYPKVWAVFEDRFNSFVKRRLWTNAVEMAAHMALLRPEVRTQLWSQLAPNMKSIKRALQVYRPQATGISRNQEQIDLYTLEACKMMSSLAILTADTAVVNNQGFIETSKKKPVSTSTQLPMRSSITSDAI